MNNHLRHHLDNLWKWKCGIEEVELNGRTELIESDQWCREFEIRMRRRLIVGAYRYGPMGHPDKKRYDRIGGAISRLSEYRRTGNAEMLVDAANLLMLEYVESNHPLFHFEAKTEGEHVERV